MITLGANCHPMWAEQSDPADRAEIRAQLKAAGVTRVRIDVGWKDVEPERGVWYWDKTDQLIEEFHADGLPVLLMLYWPPAWSSGTTAKNGMPGSGADFGNACGQAAKRYGAKLAGVELWNEPDITTFWSGTPQQFARMIADAYPVATSLSPHTEFYAAAPTYLGLAGSPGWFEAMYATGLYGPGKTHDAQSLHPYPSPSNLPPNAPASDWSLAGIPELLALRAANDDDSPLHATEFGYSTHANVGGEANWKIGVTEAEQAAFTLGTIVALQSYGFVSAYPYTDRDTAESDAHEAHFGLLYPDNSPKPVAQLLAAVAQGKPEPPDPQPPSDLEERIVQASHSIEAAGNLLVQAAIDLRGV